jgi:hypothetical protein
MTQVLKYDEACRAVAAAKSFDEVREWEDKAAAVREYSRRIHNRSLEIDALEIRERARRRRGELLIQLKGSGQLLDGRTKTVTDEVPFQRVTLDDLDVTKNESSRDQKIASLDGNSFERLVARCRTYMKDNPDKHAIDVLRMKDGPINGARSVMGSRVEPDDSLDYFPTPPWATRALVESVLRHLGVTTLGSAFDPACGEGHIAEVLCEYVKPEHVFASDIFEYGYGDAGSKYDYLNPLNIMSGPDWVVTNPPFGDKTELFVLRAIKEACVGAAMFVRLQWLESIGRYENIFRDYPPTLIAFFAERVNLCKGRWDPDGTTATAYIWLIWIKGAKPQAPFWIPPGRREALTHADDAERFTAQPVIKRAAALPPHNPETGEIAEAAE